MTLREIMTPFTSETSLFIIFPGIKINGFIFEISSFTAKHAAVIHCLSWPVVLMGTIFDPDPSTVVSLGISAHIGFRPISLYCLEKSLKFLSVFQRGYHENI